MAKTVNTSTYIFRFNSRPDMYEEYTFTFPAKTGPAYFTHSWTLNCYTLAGKFSGGRGTPNTEEDLRSFTLPLEEVVRVCTTEKLCQNFGELHIELMTETSTSLKIRYWVKCTGNFYYDSLQWTGILTCFTHSDPVPTDSKPTHLLCDGSIEPLALRNPTPGFSAVFNDLNGTSKEVQIYVATSEALLTAPDMWDSGWVLAPALEDLRRCNPITYAGSALNMATVDYYWKVRFKDTVDAVSDWSDHAHFRTGEDEDPDPREDTPTGLLCEGEAHPMAVNDPTPEFSAINNLPAASTHYEIVVSKTLAHGGYYPGRPYVWDSDWQPDSTPRWSRCSDKTYGGAALPIDDTTYYWAIRFKTTTEEAERISRWSLAGSFKVSSSEGPDPTVTGYYRIQVNTDSDFNGTMMWDSGDVPVAVAFVVDARCSDIEYLGATLDLTGKVYYWRIQLWNTGDVEHPWSVEAAFFSGVEGGDEPPVPPPDWVTAQHREPIGTAEVELVAGSDEWTNLADVMGITISNNKNPLDNIETSQGTVYLSNIDKLFYSENEASAFYKKLPGRKVRLALGATVEGTDDLYRKMTGIVKSVNVNRNSMTAEIVALEFLDYYKTRQIRRTPVYKNITVFDLFCNLIKYCFPNWKNQHETADWDYFVSPLGFRRSNLYLGAGDGGASYIIKDNTKTPPETVYNIIADSEAIYKDGVRLTRGTDYSITQVDLPQGIESTLVFLQDNPTSVNILYACVTIHTTVEAVQYEDTDLITELEKIALVADCRLYANVSGKLVCKSNELTTTVDAIRHDTHLMSLSSRVDIEDIVNHVVVNSKPYILAGERTTLGSWEVEFTRTGHAQDGEEHTFDFEYATELICDLSWSISVSNVWGEYIGSGTLTDLGFPVDEIVSVQGLWGWQDYGEIHIEVLEADSVHLVVKFWVECYHFDEWYTGFLFEATLTLKGLTVGQPITYVGEAIDEASFHDMWIGEKKQEFTFEYLEPGVEVAQQAAEALLSILCKLKTYYDCQVRGMPHLRLLDTLTVTEATALLDAKQTQVIKMVDNLKLGDYRTDLGLVVKEVPVVATPHYWTPEWYEFVINSEATSSQTFTWAFNSAILGYYFKHEWSVELNSPRFPFWFIPSHYSAIGANYDIDLPYSETLQVRDSSGDLVDFATLSITLIEETAKSVEVQYSLTLLGNFDWTYFFGDDRRWPIAVNFVGKLACIPDFSYEVVGPASLPHYPKTYPYLPSNEQPGSGYYYE